MKTGNQHRMTFAGGIDMTNWSSLPLFQSESGTKSFINKRGSKMKKNSVTRNFLIYLITQLTK